MPKVATLTANIRHVTTRHNPMAPPNPHPAPTSPTGRTRRSSSLPPDVQAWHAAVERGEAGSSAPRSLAPSSETLACQRNADEVARKYSAATRAKDRVRKTSGPKRAKSSRKGKGKTSNQANNQLVVTVKVEEPEYEPLHSPHHRTLFATRRIRRASTPREASPALSDATEVDEEAQNLPGYGAADESELDSNWEALRESYRAFRPTVSRSELPCVQSPQGPKLGHHLPYPPPSTISADASTFLSNSAPLQPLNSIPSIPPQSRMVAHTVYDELGNRKYVHAPIGTDLNKLLRKRKARDENVDPTTGPAAKSPRYDPSIAEAGSSASHSTNPTSSSGSDNHSDTSRGPKCTRFGGRSASERSWKRFKAQREPREWTKKKSGGGLKQQSFFPTLTPIDAYHRANELVRELVRERLEESQASQQPGMQPDDTSDSSLTTPPSQTLSVSPSSSILSDSPPPCPETTAPSSPRRSRRLRNLSPPPILPLPTKSKHQ